MPQPVNNVGPTEIAAATGGFHAVAEIGEGGFGKVYRAMVNHRPVACKVRDGWRLGVAHLLTVQPRSRSFVSHVSHDLSHDHSSGPGLMVSTQHHLMSGMRQAMTTMCCRSGDGNGWIARPNRIRQ